MSKSVLGVKLPNYEIFDIFFETYWARDLKSITQSKSVAIATCKCNIDFNIDKFKFCPSCGSKFKHQMKLCEYMTNKVSHYVNKLTSKKYESYENAPNFTDLEHELFMSNKNKNEFYAEKGYYTKHEVVKTITNINGYAIWHYNNNSDDDDDDDDDECIIIECIYNNNIDIEKLSNFIDMLNKNNLSEYIDQICMYNINNYIRQIDEDY